MRILHVLSALDPRYGGPSTSLLGLVRAQLAIGLKVKITATQYWEMPEWPAFDATRSEGAVINLFRFRPRQVGSIKPFRDQLEKDIRECDVVHIHALWHQEQLLAAKLAIKFDKPYVFRTCGMLAPWSLKQSSWKKFLYMRLFLGRYLERASGIHYTTLREKSVSEGIARNPSSIVEPNGISSSEFQHLPDPGLFRKEHSISPSEKIVLFLGRIHPKKGIDLLIEAFAKLDHATLIIAGPVNDSDDYLQSLLGMIDRLGLNQRVRFVGELHGDDKLAAYQDATVFVLPSYHENFGNTVIESLACGTPVIVSDQVDLCQELDGEECGQVVSLNAESIAKAINSRLAEKQTGALSEECRRFAMSNYDWQSIATRWRQHYAALKPFKA